LAGGAIVAADDLDKDLNKPIPAKTTALTKNWTVLHLGNRRDQSSKPLPKQSKLQPLDEFELTGPEPGHAFVLGNFVSDGTWGVINGAIQLAGGRNGAVRLARAGDFELEGTIEMDRYGGWFLLVGWDEGRGYSISNVTMKESGSPWFITEYRGSTAIPESHQVVARHDWERSQVVKVSVKNKVLTFTLGKLEVLKEQKLENYEEGDVIFGVYDTRYGPRPVKIHALRIRALE
jgi:hypothetical protein